MSRKDGWHPAFPSKVSESTEGYFSGMSMRDYFAAAALQGMLADDTGEYLFDDLAKASYRMADVMLAERDK